uniref:Cytochrome P450 n=1 Tax=Solanum lycopersicum TaxID=4081 RepID=A0A3Q7I1G3_SOLLC
MTLLLNNSYLVFRGSSDGDVDSLFRPLNFHTIITANPSNLQHILKTNSLFIKKDIFKVDGDIWKYQRQVASHEFNTKSLRKFVESVVDVEHGYLVSFSKLEMVVTL